MAGRSQHRDNRSSYFSSDIGRSGVYDGVNGTPINFSQRGDNPNDLRDTEGISETARESGLYASRIGSTKQPTEDYSKEGMLGSTGNFPRQNWDQSFEEGNRTPESGTYSRNIESNQYDTDYKANNDIGRSSTFDNNRDSGLYSRKIGSFRETIPENSGKDNQRQSSKHFKPNKYIGNTLDTMLEGEDESKQPEHFHSTNYSESRKYSGTARNGDYDGHSNASFQDDKEFPPWAGMMVEQQFTDKYIKTKWPRISLHLTQPRHSDPFVPGKIDEGSIDINSAKDDHKTRNTLCVIGLGTLLLCLVGAAIITVIVLANQSSDKTEYVTVNMTITVEKTFTSELNNPKSTDYKLFASEVCKQTKDVYTSANSSLSGYYGCKVSNMENGSIIVTYIIYFTGTTTQQVTPEAVKTILDSHLNVSSSQLGDLVIVTGSVTVNKVETETLSSPPPVEESVTTTTTVITTPHIETTTEVVGPSTVTTSDSETVQTTEATTLNTKQTTMETTSLTTSSTEAKTPKTVQTTTETVISTVPPTEDTTTEPKQSTMETTTSKVPTSEDTTTEPKQSTMETTTSTVPPTEDTTTETVQSTTASTTPLISSTEETTLKTVQSTGKTNTPSVSLTDETTPKTMHSTTKIITPSSSSTENTTPKTMQTETTSPIIDSTVESRSSQSTNHVSEVTTTLQTDKKTEATQETTSSKKTPTKESISSTTKEEPTTLTSTITTSSTEALSDTTTSDSTERTKTSSSLPFIDTTKPVISTSTDDTNQLITSPTTEDTTKRITSTPPDETTRLITSTSTEDTTSKMPSTSTDYTTHAEDTTKPTTSASTEESTTKLITPTSIDDTTKPVTFTSTDDTTATLTSTATVDTTKSVTSTPIEDVTKSETFTSTEKTTKHVTSTPSEDTTKTISSAPTEDTTPSITAISTEDTTTKTVSSIITEGTTLSITATSTSMPTTGRTTSDEITTVSGTTTESQNIGLNCTDSLTEVLYSGPVAIVCTIQKSDQFDYIRISHDEGSNNSIYGILLKKDGTTIQNFVENQDINVTINSISTINLVLTFVNVSCAMEGFYKVAIISNRSGEMKESVSRKIQLEVSSPAEKPILTLNADQVIDLIFNNNTNDYFRAEGLHQCEGYVGRPPSNLEITITHDNGTSFQTISQENIYLNISKMSDGCRNKELIKFGLRFTPGMVGSKLRCGVKDSANDFTLSEELSLIPRNICSCAVSESYRAHPSNCKVKVFCIEDGGIMYPTGVSCPSNECRNSITGYCTTNCSNAVCEETVPSDFCTTPAPPTTTPAPSPYISCVDDSFSINSGAAVVTCSLNDSATFTMMNVTYKKKGDSEAQHIAAIDASNIVQMLAMQDNVNISIFANTISITIFNPSCENEGSFGIVTTINSETVEAQGQFSLQYPPGNATLQLNADQVIDLGFYRKDRLHSCTGLIGNPPQELILEILYANTTGYQELSGPILEDLKRNKTTTSCKTFESITFGLRFSSEMEGAKIRCRPAGNINNDTLAEDSLFLIQRDICACGSPENDRGHPGRCNVRILCLAANNLMYPLGVACPDGQCRNSITGICSSDCSASVCNEEVPTDFCLTTDIPETTPIPPMPSVDVLCNGSSTEVNTGPVDIVCYFNQTIYDFINISFTMRNETISKPVADIQADGSVVMNYQTSNLVIQINVNVITIRTKIATCDFGGTYKVTVDNGGTPGFSSGTLEILTKPGKPSIDQQLHIVNGTKVTYTCSGNVGNPPGSIEFLVRKNGEENFTVSSIDLTSSEVLPNDNCNNEQTFYHEHTVTSDWNMTTIKCRAVNPRTITANDDMNLYISDEEEIVALSADYCSLPTKEYKPHPRGCVYYVRCVNSVIYSQQCGTGTCFSSANILSPCDFCRNVPPPCNATLS